MSDTAEQVNHDDVNEEQNAENINNDAGNDEQSAPPPLPADDDAALVAVHDDQAKDAAAAAPAMAKKPSQIMSGDDVWKTEVHGNNTIDDEDANQNNDNVDDEPVRIEQAPPAQAAPRAAAVAAAPTKHDNRVEHVKQSDQANSKLPARKGSRRGTNLAPLGLVYEGKLEKLGGKTFKNWQERFFSLRGDILFWYAFEDAPLEQKSLQLNAQVKVDGPTKEEMDKNGFFNFSITKKDREGKKTWKLRVIDAVQGREWLRRLSLAGASVEPAQYAVSSEEQQEAAKRYDEYMSAQEERAKLTSIKGVIQEVPKEVVLEGLKKHGHQERDR